MDYKTLSDDTLITKYFHLRKVSRQLIKVYDAEVLDYNGRISLGNIIMSLSYKWLKLENEIEIRFADSGLKPKLEEIKNFNQK